MFCHWLNNIMLLHVFLPTIQPCFITLFICFMMFSGCFQPVARRTRVPKHGRSSRIGPNSPSPDETVDISATAAGSSLFPSWCHEIGKGNQSFKWNIIINSIYIYMIYIYDIYIYMIYIYIWYIYIYDIYIYTHDIYIYIWYIYIYIWYIYTHMIYIYIWYIYIWWIVIMLTNNP